MKSFLDLFTFGDVYAIGSTLTVDYTIPSYIEDNFLERAVAKSDYKTSFNCGLLIGVVISMFKAKSYMADQQIRDIDRIELRNLERFGSVTIQLDEN